LQNIHEARDLNIIQGSDLVKIRYHTWRPLFFHKKMTNVDSS
jgi:hypothetical protein